MARPSLSTRPFPPRRSTATVSLSISAAPMRRSRQGWQVDVVDLGQGFPWPDQATRSSARTRLLVTPTGRRVVVDGLALGVLPETASEIAGRNPLLALVHHPLALERGLSLAQAEALR